MSQLEVIDFHHHARPASFWEAMARRGVTVFGGRKPTPPGNPERTLELMDRNGISVVMWSAPDAEIHFADRDFGIEQARGINEFFAGAVQRWPTRYGAFVTLPMPHVDASLKEMEYGLDTLGFDGVLLLSSYNGKYPGCPEFDPILEELNRRKAFCFIHPSTPIGMDLFQIDVPVFVQEFVNDTTRCITNLVEHDVTARFPDIRFLFGHAGGNALWLAQRLALMDVFHRRDSMGIDDAKAKWSKALRSFWYDTALSSADHVYTLLRDVVGIDRVLFGSDAPQAPEAFVAHSIAGLRNSRVLSDAEKYAIAQGNGHALLPRLFKPAKAAGAQAAMQH